MYRQPAEKVKDWDGGDGKGVESKASVEKISEKPLTGNFSDIYSNLRS